MLVRGEPVSPGRCGVPGREGGEGKRGERGGYGRIVSAGVEIDGRRREGHAEDRRRKWTGDKDLEVALTHKRYRHI